MYRIRYLNRFSNQHEECKQWDIFLGWNFILFLFHATRVTCLSPFGTVISVGKIWQTVRFKSKNEASRATTLDLPFIKQLHKTLEYRNATLAVTSGFSGTPSLVRLKPPACLNEYALAVHPGGMIKP